jgi:hypothetical protein
MSSNNSNSTLTLRYPPAQAPEQKAPEKSSEQNFNQAAPVVNNFGTPRLHTGNLLSRSNAPQSFSSSTINTQQFTPQHSSSPSSSLDEDDEKPFYELSLEGEASMRRADEEERQGLGKPLSELEI